MDLDTVNTIVSASFLMATSWILGYYSFSILWIWLLAVLVGLKFRLWRSREKRVSALQYVAMKEKEAILAHFKDVPAWVDFSDSEKVEWMNKIIRQSWPYISEYAVRVFREDIEPGIRSNMPSTFSGLQFEKMDIGKTPLRVDVIKVFRNEEAGFDRLTIDIDIEYDGDCEVIISVNFMKAGVRKVKVKGRLRVIMAPLVPRPPLIQAVSAFFITQPLVSFDLTGLGELLELPALSKAMKEVINKQISDMCVLPNQIVVPLVPDADIVRLYTPEFDGAVRIFILEAKDLENKDFGFMGLSDPYAKLSVGAQTYRTKTVDNDLNPVWNEVFEAVVHHVSGQQLRVELYDEDPGMDDSLGDVIIELAEVREKGMIDEWIPLKNVTKGQIHLLIFWLDLALEPHGPDSPNVDISLDCGWELSTALVMAYVDRALVPAQPNFRKPSPFLELILDDQKQKTYPKSSTLEPVYQEKFFFFSAFSDRQLLHLEVKDSGKRQQKLAQGHIPLVDLLKNERLELYKETVLLRTEELEQGSKPSGHVDISVRLRFLHFAVGRDIALAKISALELKNVEKGVLAGFRAGLDNMVRRKSLLDKRQTSTKHIGKQRRAKSVLDIRRNEELGKIQLTVCYTAQWSQVVVVVHQITGLIAFNQEKNADPFVEIQVRKRGGAGGSQKHSSVHHDTLNPVFDETFEFKLSEHDMHESVVIVKVKDSIKYKLLAAKPTFGKVTIDLADFNVERPVQRKWFSLAAEEKISRLKSVTSSRISLFT